MKRYTTAKVIAALFLGLMLGVYVHFDEMRWAARGREAFLSYENQRFDQRMVAPHSAVMLVMVAPLFAGVGFGLYELIAAGIVRVLPPSTAEEL